MKRAILVVTFLAVSIGIAGYARQETLRAEQTAAHHAQDLAAAAQVKAFPSADHPQDAAYMGTIIQADLLSLDVCQSNHKLFVNEPLSSAMTNANEKSFVDAEAAAECVVELQSAAREVPATHPAYPDIRTELAWWNSKLMQLDPADYHRLNPEPVAISPAKEEGL